VVAEDYWRAAGVGWSAAGVGALYARKQIPRAFSPLARLRTVRNDNDQLWIAPLKRAPNEKLGVISLREKQIPRAFSPLRGYERLGMTRISFGSER
jgi:hypothetical protein